MLVPAFLGGFGLPFDAFDVALDLGAAVPDVDAVRGDASDVAVLEVRDVARVFDERRDVARDEVRTVAVPEDERTVLAGDDGFFAASDRHRDRVTPLEAVDDVLDGRNEVDVRPGTRLELGAVVDAAAVARSLPACGELCLKEVRDDLGVGLARELVLVEHVSERVVVLDDAVVDDGDVARTVDVGMCVRVGRLAVRRPARVPDARPRRIRFGEVQVVDDALLFEHVDVVVADERDPSRVVPAVLEVPQTVHEHG